MLADAETVLFVGAGATASLGMPTSAGIGRFLWDVCEREGIDASELEELADCFKGNGEAIANLLRAVDGGDDGAKEIVASEEFWGKCFPGVKEEDVRRTAVRLRRNFDWGALKLIAREKRNGAKEFEGRDFIQEVYTLMDVCIRDGRGFRVYGGGTGEIVLTVERVKAAYATLNMLMNTMFACAWQRLVKDGRGKLEPYLKFFKSLARLMQEEGERFAEGGARTDSSKFYRFSYSVATTNFEPIFLWLIWMGHLEANKTNAPTVLNPGRKTCLRMNFPVAVGMRKPERSDETEEDAWFPCTDAVAQNVNNPDYASSRVFRVGTYYPVHGMSVMRTCPVCGNVNLYLGNSWDEHSRTLFTNGFVKGLDFADKWRTEAEEAAFAEGGYDALECCFCGGMTYAYDNFIYPQTQLKCPPPAHVKATTDEALAAISKAKHIVLLGYSMPIDDAIWGSLLSMMAKRNDGERLFCSVAATYDPKGPDGWLYGERLREYLESVDGTEKCRAIKNAITVFGEENVRAYVKGVPDVFGEGGEDDVRELLYPEGNDEWRLKAFAGHKVQR